MSGNFNGMLDGSFISPAGSQGGLIPRATGSGGGGTVDAIARSLAGTASNNINAITPQANKIIPNGGVVFTPNGAFENVTGGPLPLGATNPPTAASLQTDGLTPVAGGTIETNTNFTVPNAAFADNENPTAPEAKVWYDANVGAGLTFNTPQNAGDMLFYTSPAGDSHTWAIGDGDAGTPDISLVGTAGTDPIVNQGTNIPVPNTAFADNEAPLSAETKTWYDANVGVGLTFNMEQTGSDLLFYTSPLGKEYVWAAGDAEGGTADMSLVSSMGIPAEQGTNITVAQAAFADVENPTLAELNVWKTANVGAGLTFPVTQTSDDVYIYSSPAGKLYTWIAGDAEAGTDALSLASIYDPQAGGFEQITLSAIAPITANPNPAVLKSIELTATAPTSVVDTVTVVSYPVSAPTNANQRIDLIRNTAVEVHLAGTFSNYVDPVIDEDARKITLTAISNLSGWTISTGGN